MESDRFEELHRRYRHAMRTADHLAALEAVRALAEEDDTQDWIEEVRAAEERVWREHSERFVQAEKAGDEATCLQLAQSVLFSEWAYQPSSDGVAHLQRWYDAHEANRRQQEGNAALDTLASLLSANWSFADAEASIAKIESLVGEGWNVPDDRAATLAAAEARCEADRLEHERDEAYRKACFTLRQQINQRLTDALMLTLRREIFQIRPAPQDLVDAAKRIIADDQISRRHRRIAIVSMLVIVTLAGLTGGGYYGYLKYQEHQDEEAREAAAAAQKKQRLAEQEKAEAEELQQLLEKVKTFAHQGWVDHEQEAEAAIKRGLEIAKTEADRAQLTKYDNNLKSVKQLFEEQRKEDATSEIAALTDTINEFERMCKLKLPDPAIDSLAATNEVRLATWKSVYAPLRPDLNDEALEAEKRFTDARQYQADLKRLIAQIEREQTPTALAMKREELIKKYGDTCPEIKALATGYARPRDVTSLLGGTTAEQQKNYALLFIGGSDAASGYRRANATPLKELSRIKGLFCGKLVSSLADPASAPAQVKLVTEANPSVPLYFLKRVDGRLGLVPAAEFRDHAWHLLPDAQKPENWNVGLYQPQIDNTSVDIYRRLGQILKDAPDDDREKIVGDLPFVITSLAVY